MVDPSTSRSSQVMCMSAIKTKMIEKIAREVMKGKYNSPIWINNFRLKKETIECNEKLIA